jgi:hypothetical protein
LVITDLSSKSIPTIVEKGNVIVLTPKLILLDLVINLLHLK